MGCCKPRTIGLIVSAIGIILIVIGCILGFGVIPGIIDDQVAENVQLVEGSEAYERWDETPMSLKFKVFIFNVQNPKDVMKGEMPVVEEVGPYVYDLYRKKLNISYVDGEDAWEYWQNSYFEFNAKESAPYAEDDVVSVLNVAKYGVLQKGESMDAIMTEKINDNLDYIFTDSKKSLFHTLTVGQMLFQGYNFCKLPAEGLAASVCAIIRKQSESIETLSKTADNSLLFAFFKHKQNKRDGPYVVNAGIEDANQVGEIMRWKNKTVLDLWGTGENICNNIRGRDSSIYPPFNDEDSVHEVFNTDVCRILTLQYEGEGTYKDIDGILSTLSVENLSNDGDRECYCVKEATDINGEYNCLPKGFGDLTPCTGASVLMSFPHFLDADPTYASTVNGTNPDPELHRTYVLMEPKTGSPLQGAKRMQFNMIIREMEPFDVTKGIAPSVIPILWVEEGVALTDELVEKLNNQYFDKLVAVDAVVYTLIGVGAVLAIIGGAVFIIKK